jgi:hypothetical protein
VLGLMQYTKFHPNTTAISNNLLCQDATNSAQLLLKSISNSGSPKLAQVDEYATVRRSRPDSMAHFPFADDDGNVSLILHDSLKEQPDFLLKKYLSNLLSHYNETCNYFYLFYNELFNDIGLYNFHKYVFILEL